MGVTLCWPLERPQSMEVDLDHFHTGFISDQEVASVFFFLKYRF